jgi:serine/threonine-protein kinase RsbT
LNFGHPSRLPIAHSADRFAAGPLVERLAKPLGFSAYRIAEAIIIACELADNLASHAGGGYLEVSVCISHAILSIASVDRGPPIRDLQLALTDGYTDTGPISPERLSGRAGIGSGLGAVRRLSNLVVFCNHTIGKTITAYLSSERIKQGVSTPVIQMRNNLPATSGDGCKF